MISEFNRVDPNTLGWVKTEIDQTLHDGRTALDKFADQAGDVTPLRMFVNQLHQVVGTLQMVELDGAAQLAHEIEAVAVVLMNGADELQHATATAALDEGLARLSGHLEALERGALDLPISNVETLNRLRAARGEPPIDPYTLFTPELDVFPPLEEAARELDDAEFRYLVHQRRRDFQAGLLGWLREPANPDTLTRLADVTSGLQRVARFESNARLWWVADAYLRMLAGVELGKDDPRKRLPAQLDQVMRMLVDDGEAAVARVGTDELTRAMLYQIAHSDCDNAAVSAINHAFDLRAILGLPDAVATTADEAQNMAALAARVTGDLQHAREALETYSEAAAGDRESRLAKVSEGMGLVATAAAELAVAPIRDLANEIIELARAIAENKPVDREQAALRMAAAILFLEQVLAEPDEHDGSWRELLDEHVEKLQVMQRDVVDLAGLTEQVADSTQPLSRYEIKRLLGAVAQEIYVNLGRAEDALESFSGETTNIEPLRPAADYLKQIQGALRILGQHRIDEVVALSIDYLQGLGDGRIKPSIQLIEALAVAVGTVETYVHGLEQGRTDLHILVERALHDLENAVADRALDELDAAAAVVDLQAALDAWLADNSDFASFRILRQHLRDLSSLSAKRGKSRLRRVAQEVSNLLDIVTEDPSFLSPEVEQTLRRSLEKLAQWIGDLSDEPPAVVEAEPVATAAELSEIQNIFLEEAAECVDAIDDNLARWQAEPDDNHGPTELRRAFHTIKGSGRMAEAGVIAELGRTVEDVLNEVLAGKVSASDDLFAFIKDARVKISELVRDQLRDSDAVDLDSWRARAAQLSEGQPSATTPETEAATETPVVALPPAAETAAPSDETAPDSTVTRIYVIEANGHLATIREHIERCRRDAAAGTITPDLTRAIHTLRGSSRSMQLVEMSDAYSRLDGLFATLDSVGGRIQAGELELLEHITRLSEKVVADLDSGTPVSVATRDDFEHLVGRIARRERERGERQRHLSEIAAELQVSTDTRAPLDIAAPDPSTTPEDELEARILALDPLVPGVVSEAQGNEVPNSAPAETPAAGEDIGDGIRDIFREEAVDILARIDAGIAGWKQGGDWRTAAAALKRDLHTLKGSARAAGERALGDLGHNAETLLESLDRAPSRDPAVAFLLLEEVHDTLVDGVRCLAEGQALPPFDSLNRRLTDDGALDDLAAQTQAGAETATEEQQPVAAGGTGAEALTAKGEAPPSGAGVVRPAFGAAAAGKPQPATADQTRTVRVKSQVLDKLFDYAGEVSVSRSQIHEQLSGLKTNLKDLRGNVLRFSEQLRELEIQAETQVHARVAEQQHVQEQSTQGHEFDPLEFDRYTSLQELSRGLSESLDDLVTIQNSLNQFANHTESTLQQQAHLSSELQDRLMSTRMVPFSTLLPRLRHQVRQTTRELGKDAELEVNGGGVEIDRNVLDGLVETLEHMIRNAIDHGIETPERRTGNGKPAVGRIRIDCSQEGNEVVLKFSDDGAGLDVAKIRAKAEALGFVRDNVRFDDQELIQLIVMAGFTTADRVTKLSGRGVGLDVVHNAVRRFGGSITVANDPGRGVVFVLRLPISLSITQALFVRCGAQEFAISIAVVDRIIKIGANQLSAATDGADGQMTHDGQTYPVMDLGLRLGLSTGLPAPDRIPIMLVRMGAREVAVRIDEVMGTQEVVVKAVGSHLAAVDGIAGATVRGDGSVVLILDLAALWLAAAQVAASPQAAPRRETPVVMVVDDSLTVRKVTSRNLHRVGIEVIMAKDGIDALEQINKTPPDVMLVDIEMPRMDGYELTERVRAASHSRDIPILVITSRAGSKHREKAMALGANAYLTKPYQEEQLIEHVRQLLPEELAANLQ